MRLTTVLSRLAGLALVAAALVGALPAAAAGEASATWLGLPTWIWMLANLVIFFGLLGYLLAPPINSFLDARARRIHEELEEAREQRAEAAELQAGLGQKVAALEAQIEEILARAETEGHREHDAILEQAVHEQDRLLAQAQREIDHRLVQARQELKDFTAELSARLAREQLERELGREDRRRIFRRNLARLEEAS
jgi:F-type H+-transporting ATPase subunit b